MPPTAENPCERLADLIPAYSIGATDPDETAFVQAHLADCPEAAAHLAEFAHLAEGLHYAVPPAQAPAHLLTAIRRQTAPSPAARALRPVRRWVQGAAAAATIALIVGINLFWAARLEDAERRQAVLRAQLTDQQTALALIGAADVQRTSLPAINPAIPDAPPAATLVSAPSQAVAVLTVQYFPALAPDKTYQIWLIKAGQRVSGGLFRVDSEGGAMVIVRAPMALSAYDEVGITPEPAGGSAAPTAPPIVRGPIWP